MFNLKKRLLQQLPKDTALAEREEFEKLQIATCVILLEVAKSDYEFSSIEKETMSSILKKKYDLPDEAAKELIEIAKKKREESVDLWEFADLINVNYTREEKIRIVESAWKIIYADEKLDMYEDHLIHVLQKLLRLDHCELIDAKLKVKNSEG